MSVHHVLRSLLLAAAFACFARAAFAQAADPVADLGAEAPSDEAPPGEEGQRASVRSKHSVKGEQQGSQPSRSRFEQAWSVPQPGSPASNAEPNTLARATSREAPNSTPAPEWNMQGALDEAHGPKQKRRFENYGAPFILVDLVSALLVVGRDRDATAWGGAAVYSGVAPGVHLAHSAYAKATASFGVRALLSVLAVYSGECDDDTSRDECDAQRFTNAFLSYVLLSGFSVVDLVWLARQPVPAHEAAGRASWRIVPNASLAKGGGSVGFQGAF